MISARWANFAGWPELPVPPTIPVRPTSWTLRTLIAVWPAGTDALTCAFQRTESVNPGGMSRFQVAIVAPPESTRPGLAAAHPDGVMVQPAQGSSNPHPMHQTSSWAGTVSQIWTSHHVFVVERFLMKTE